MTPFRANHPPWHRFCLPRGIGPARVPVQTWYAGEVRVPWRPLWTLLYQLPRFGGVFLYAVRARCSTVDAEKYHAVLCRSGRGSATLSA